MFWTCYGKGYNWVGQKNAQTILNPELTNL